MCEKNKPSEDELIRILDDLCETRREKNFISLGHFEKAVNAADRCPHLFEVLRKVLNDNLTPEISGGSYGVGYPAWIINKKTVNPVDTSEREDLRDGYQPSGKSLVQGGYRPGGLKHGGISKKKPGKL